MRSSSTSSRFSDLVRRLRCWIHARMRSYLQRLCVWKVGRLSCTTTATPRTSTPGSNRSRATLPLFIPLLPMASRCHTPKEVISTGISTLRRSQRRQHPWVPSTAPLGTFLHLRLDPRASRRSVSLSRRSSRCGCG
eukprot:Rmarinus@m.17877